MAITNIRAGEAFRFMPIPKPEPKKAGYHRNLLVMIPEKGSAFLKILKNAQSSVGRAISEGFPESYTVEKNDTKDYPREITVLWRNPADRTESLFRMASELKMAAVRNEKIPHPRLGWEYWVLELLKNPLINDHCLPQMELARNQDGRFLPTVEFFFDDIPALMAHYGIRMVSKDKWNISPRNGDLVWSQELRELHRDVYRDDWEKWESRELAR